MPFIKSNLQFWQFDEIRSPTKQDAGSKNNRTYSITVYIRFNSKANIFILNNYVTLPANEYALLTRLPRVKTASCTLQGSI